MFGVCVLSYQWSIDGEIEASPTYWTTTNGFGLILPSAVANLLETKSWVAYGRVNTSPVF